MTNSKFLYDAKRGVVIELWPVDGVYFKKWTKYYSDGTSGGSFNMTIYRDSEGCIYSLRDLDSSVDPLDRCGVGLFSVDDKELLDVCKVHDYMYSSPAYQLFHSRAEADNYMYKHMAARRPIVGRIFYALTRVFGGLFWEGPK